MSELVLTATVERELVALARAAAPREMVAVLGGDGAAVHTVLPLPNTVGADDAFQVDPIAFARAERRLRRAGARFVGFAHSHPRGSALPSARDRRELWPGCLQVIVGLGGTAPTVRAFRLERNPEVQPS